ncbi:MAG: thioredoxin family protein [Bacteroidetes bacterium]|nr:thioredoxin family protein [Bacteroidota bacterium]
MKKLITTLSFILFMGVVAVSAQCSDCETADNCTSLKVTSAENQKSSEVKAYYFHASRRCATCEAVEAVTEEALKEYYGTKVPFQSINIEEVKDKPLLEKYKISGQTLLIIKGDKQVNLTNDAFMYARTNPDKFKAKLKSTIDSMN